MTIWLILNQMVDYACGPCSSIGWMMDDFCQFWHNYFGMFVPIHIDLHFQLSYYIILTKIICSLIGS
jgi:hypothetical protein